MHLVLGFISGGIGNNLMAVQTMLMQGGCNHCDLISETCVAMC